MSTPFPAPAEGEERPQREVAQRVFAAEFNDAKHAFKGDGERSPRYAVSRYGSKINRLFVVGVLTRVESGQTQSGSYRAHVVDPTGTFTVWAGQFEPEASAQLAELHPPQVVAVVGKASVRDVDGTTYVNMRAEDIRVVPEVDRHQWTLEAAKHSMLRLDALKEAQKMEKPTQKALEDLGYPADVAEGVVRAVEHYGKADLPKYVATIRDALETLLPGGAEKIHATPEFAPAAAAYSPPAPAARPGAAPAKPAAPAGAAAKEVPHKADILALVEKLDDTKGAPWEDIVAEASKKNIREEAVEEALNALMDDGVIYEPVLGRLKKT